MGLPDRKALPGLPVVQSAHRASKVRRDRREFLAHKALPDRRVIPA